MARGVKIFLQNFKEFSSLSDLALRENVDCLRIHRARCTRFVPQSRDFGSARASSRRFSSFLTPASILTQKSSGTLIRSVLKEETDLTNAGRALVSNQAAEHHGY